MVSLVPSLGLRNSFQQLGCSLFSCRQTANGWTWTWSQGSEALLRGALLDVKRNQILKTLLSQSRLCLELSLTCEFCLLEDQTQPLNWWISFPDIGKTFSAQQPKLKTRAERLTREDCIPFGLELRIQGLRRRSNLLRKCLATLQQGLDATNLANLSPRQHRRSLNRRIIIPMPRLFGHTARRFGQPLLFLTPTSR